MNQFEPTPEQWDNIFNDSPKPTEEDIANRPKPEDIADISGRNVLGQRDRDLIERQDKDAAAIEETRKTIEKISRKN
jgi:hypothetical protein